LYTVISEDGIYGVRIILGDFIQIECATGVRRTGRGEMQVHLLRTRGRALARSIAAVLTVILVPLILVLVVLLPLLSILLILLVVALLLLRLLRWGLRGRCLCRWLLLAVSWRGGGWLAVGLTVARVLAVITVVALVVAALVVVALVVVALAITLVVSTLVVRS